MEWHLAKITDVYLRSAMWESYNKKCIYCGIALEPRHAQIDHIIPIDEENLKKKNDLDLRAYLYELKEQGFNNNSIENYALTCSSCNSRKGNYAFSASNFRFYHEYAARHYSKINKKYIKYKSQIDSNKEKSVEIGFNKKWDNRDLLCEKSVISSVNTVHFSYGLGAVRIDAFLSADYDKEISCLILFKELGVSSVYFTFEEKEIKEYLFSGYNTDIESGKRRWYVHYDSLPDEEIYEIRLPHIRLAVTLETIQQMAKICDALYEEYITQEIGINNILGLHFPKTENHKFKLLKIRNDVKEMLMFYVKNHIQEHSDYDDENFFIFSETTSSIYLCKEGTDEPYAKIELVKGGDYYDVLWTPTEENRVYRRLFLGIDTAMWTAEYTYEKFVVEYIPSALKEYEWNKRSLLKKIFTTRGKLDYSEEYLLENGLIRSYLEEYI